MKLLDNETLDAIRDLRNRQYNLAQLGIKDIREEPGIQALRARINHFFRTKTEEGVESEDTESIASLMQQRRMLINIYGAEVLVGTFDLTFDDEGFLEYLSFNEATE